MARPEPGAVLRATFIPALRIDAQSLSLIVACIGTSLSAYIYTWQSNQEVEEQIALGRRRLWQRKGATASAMQRKSRAVLTGKIFSNLHLYSILLAPGINLPAARQTEIDTAPHHHAAPRKSMGRER